MKIISTDDAKKSFKQPATLGRRSFVKSVAGLGAGIAALPFLSSAAEVSALASPGTPAGSGQSQGRGTAPFEGDKIDWHGFDRYDFVMDEQTLSIVPFKALAGEESGSIAAPSKGQRRCVVVVPKQPAAGSPWSWRGVYWNHQPQTEIELLKRGFHIAYISADGTLKPGRQWDAWYGYLTQQHGLSSKPAFVGMSRGGEYSYAWATANPDRVSCIYADNPGMNKEAMKRIAELAWADVPVLHVCGSIDPLLGKHSIVIENIYVELGGRISVMIKEGFGHHPHSLRNPKPIADFIEQSVREVAPAAPAFVGADPIRTTYYSTDNSYREFPEEGTYITCRGALFAPCYSRYEFNLAGVEGSTTVIVPKIAASGMPWVFRAGYDFTDAKVDLALLAKGFHIVTGPVGYNFDGPVVEHWNAVYQHLVAHGFSTKPVMEGAGGAAGEVYAWAIENPGKVACIYAENPVVHSNLAKTQPLDNLSPLAKAKVPILHVCGELDPHLKDNTLVVEKRYKQLGGQIEVTLKKNDGHYPLAPQDTSPVVKFITRQS